MAIDPHEHAALTRRLAEVVEQIEAVPKSFPERGEVAHWRALLEEKQSLEKNLSGINSAEVVANVVEE